jgi:hypothetical protein
LSTQAGAQAKGRTKFEARMTAGRAGGLLAVFSSRLR